MARVGVEAGGLARGGLVGAGGAGRLGGLAVDGGDGGGPRRRRGT